MRYLIGVLAAFCVVCPVAAQAENPPGNYPSDSERLCILARHLWAPVELAELGYDDLSVERLVEFQIHDVTPSYIKRLAKRGERDLSPRELVERKIYGR